MAPPPRYLAPGPRGQNAFQDGREDKERDAEYAMMLEERRRWRAAANQASHDNLPLAVGALGAVAVPFAGAYPAIASALAKDAAWAGAAGAGVRAAYQAANGGLRALDPKAILGDGWNAAIGSPLGTLGGRYGGFPAEVLGTYANARIVGASHEDAMFGAAGAALAHPFGHGRLESSTAAGLRKAYQALIGEGVSQAGSQANGNRRQQ